MALQEVKTFKISCDNCAYFEFVTGKGKDYRPRGWILVSYSTDGSGHYGLPYKKHVKDLCPTCIVLDLEIPKKAFKINIKNF